jgi:protein-L-isoaspartate(D-aspartate) O-methyltransferase
MGTDYQDARQKMVDNQIRTTDVTSHSVLKAFLTVAREDFVPSSLKPLAYIDTICRFSSADEDGVARLSHGAVAAGKVAATGRDQPDHVVLEIGSAARDMRRRCSR